MRILCSYLIFSFNHFFLFGLIQFQVQIFGSQFLAFSMYLLDQKQKQENSLRWCYLDSWIVAQFTQKTTHSKSKQFKNNCLAKKASKHNQRVAQILITLKNATLHLHYSRYTTAQEYQNSREQTLSPVLPFAYNVQPCIVQAFNSNKHAVKMYMYICDGELQVYKGFQKSLFLAKKSAKNHEILGLERVV